MANFKVGDKGRNILINASFDLSANTDLEIKFTRPDQTILLVDKAGGVTAPAVNVDVIVDIDGEETIQTFLANEYFLYPWVTGDLDQSGTWVGNGIYIEGATKEFCGDAITFVVLPC